MGGTSWKAEGWSWWVGLVGRARDGVVKDLCNDDRPRPVSLCPGASDGGVQYCCSCVEAEHCGHV